MWDTSDAKVKVVWFHSSSLRTSTLTRVSIFPITLRPIWNLPAQLRECFSRLPNKDRNASSLIFKVPRGSSKLPLLADTDAHFLFCCWRAEMHLEFGKCPRGKSSPRKESIMAQERDDEAHGDAEGLADLRSLNKCEMEDVPVASEAQTDYIKL